MMRLTKYNPARMDASERARLFTGRESELEALLEIVRENTRRSANQHVLVTGPRGIGKTTLLLRVVDLVREDPVLSDQWFPVVASEEIYRVSSIGEFWLEMLFHLGRASNDARHAESYERLRAERDERRLAEAARGVLLDFAEARGQRLLLVVENLQLLLDGQMADSDAWALRETLIGEPRIMMLASAVSSFRQIENPNAALFELFLVRPLEPLDTEGCRRLWQAATGREIAKGRIRAIEILTGGNPRLLVILSEFASTASFRQLMEDLVGLIDEHTDYLKSTTEALPPIERRVFVSLAELWSDSSAAEVAAEARLDVNTTSAQLARLEKRGAVVSKRKGRAKRYRLAERLYNIYHLMRRHGDSEARVRAAVEFMAAYYDPDASPTGLWAVAEKALALDRKDDALDVLREAMTADPTSVHAAKALAHLRIDQDRPQEAVEVLAALLAIVPPDAPEFVRAVTSIAVRLAAGGLTEKTLRVIESSQAAPLLEPLVVGLKRRLGIEASAPHEIEEVAGDIVREIRGLAAGSPGASSTGRA